MKSARMDIRAAAWATPALRPRGRDGIFSGLMQYDAGMPDAKANGRGGQRGTASQATQQTKRRNSAGLKTREQDEEKGWQEGRWLCYVRAHLQNPIEWLMVSQSN